MGYLPEAVLNYLVRLGWSHGDDEIISIEQMIAWFDIGAINRGAARFDFAKLESINGHYLRQRSDDDLLATLLAALPHLPGGAEFAAKLDPTRRNRLRAALPLLKERAKTLADLITGAAFIVAERPLQPDAAAAVLLTEDSHRLLAGLLPALTAVSDWSAGTTEAAVKAFATERGVKLGAIAQPLRAALTGRAASPGIFEVLTILGREESLARIADQAWQ
jgi:glutamyl-tRNA synthetase